jgi:hypothetical protein
MCTMMRRVFSSIAFLPASRGCRLLAIVCCVLTLWAAFDSQVLPPGDLLSTSQNPSPCDGDDDYVLSLTGNPALTRVLQRNARLPARGLSLPIVAASFCFSLSSHRGPLPTTPVGEHEYRNGIGAPLLC